MIFQGDLSKYHPADALMFLSQLGLNGVLSVACDQRMLSLSFKDGALLDAQSVAGDEKILRTLRFQKKIDASQYARINRIRSETAIPVRQILGELQFFPLSDISKILIAGIREVLLELFLMDSGTFVFTDTMVDEDGTGISLDTGPAAVAILAQADEFHDFKKTIISLERNLTVALSPGPPVDLSMTARAVMAMAARAYTVRQLIETAPFGTYTVMTAVNSLLEQKLLTLGPVAEAPSVLSGSQGLDPLFASYRQALKMLVRADGILKKVEAVISFCKHHYDGVLILTAKEQRFIHCKAIRLDQSRGIVQESIKEDLGGLDQEPVFQAVVGSGTGFFGKIFSSPLIQRLTNSVEEGECALLPIVKRPDIAMFFFAYTSTPYTGLSPHHYLELLSWLISPVEAGSADQTVAVNGRSGVSGQGDSEPVAQAMPAVAAVADADAHSGAAAVVAKIEELPPLPALASKSLTMLSDPDVSLAEVEAVIAKDQALVAKIIKVSNSALYGGLQKVTSLRQALARLGAKTTKSLVLAASARGYFVNQRQGVKIWGQMLWQHAVECGIAARRVATAVAYEDPEQAFISGIMHDIGKVAILMLYPEKYKLIQKLKSADKLTDLQAEIQTIQTDHTHIGQLLMDKWYMPEAVRACLEFHHQPAAAGPYRQLALIVAYANFLSHAYGEHPQADAAADQPEIRELVARLGLSAAAERDVVKAVQDDFQSSEEMAD